MWRAPGGLRRRIPVSAKFALVTLLAGVAIATVPLVLSRADSQRQAVSRTADKAGVVTGLLGTQRDALTTFANGMAQQLAPAEASADRATVAATLQRDSQVNQPGDVIGVTGLKGTLLYRSGAVLTDPAVTAALAAAASSGAELAAGPEGRPWIVGSARMLAGSIVVFAARELESTEVTSLTHSITTDVDVAGVAVAHGDSYAVDGWLAGAPVTAGARVDSALRSLVSSPGTSAVVDVANRELALTSMSLGGGFVALISSPVAPIAGLPAQALLLLAVILVAMLVVIAIVQNDLQRPLRELDRAVASLAEGDLDAPIPTGEDSELGRLARTFEAMRGEMRATLRGSAARAAIASQLNAPQGLRDSLARVVEELRSGLDAETALVVVRHFEYGDGLAVAAGAGEELDPETLLAGDGPMGVAYRSSSGGAVEMGALRGTEEARMGMREVCAAPLRAGGDTLGVIAVGRDAGSFGPARRSIVESAAEQVALSLERYRVLAMAQRQASIDDLTGLHNHRFLVENLGQQIALAERMDTPLSVLMLDLDHFKQLNDTYGHDAGDAALRTFANTLSTTIRRSDLAARYGGEEFVVVMANTGRKDAALVAEKIREAVASTPLPLGSQGNRVSMTVSIGVASYPEGTTSGSALLHRADQALYAAKRAGRNRVQLAEADSSSVDTLGRIASRRTGTGRHTEGGGGRAAE